MEGGAYENPKAVVFKSGAAAASQAIEETYKAIEFAKKKKQQDKALLEDGAIERAQPFENQTIDLKRKGSPIQNQADIATMMADKYYANEKKFGNKEIDANEYRRVRQNLWTGLGALQTLQKNSVATGEKYKEALTSDSVSMSADGLEKKKRLDSFYAGKAEIFAGDDGMPYLRIHVPDVKDDKEVLTQFEKPVSDFINNPELLSFKEKADLTKMNKIMKEHALSDMHVASSIDTINYGNRLQRTFYNRKEATSFLKEDPDLKKFVEANLESIVEDYMDKNMIYIPNTPQTQELYSKQLEKAVDWYSNHVYENQLGHQIDKRVLPQPKSSRLPGGRGSGTRYGIYYTRADKAHELENWDGDKSALTHIDPQLMADDDFLYYQGVPVLNFRQGDSWDRQIRDALIKMKWIVEKRPVDPLPKNQANTVKAVFEKGKKRIIERKKEK